MECRYASDQTLLVSFGTEIRLEVNEQVRRLLRLLEEEPIPGVVNLHPAYCSVLIRFDPLALSHRELERVLRARLAEAAHISLPAPRLVEIPVCYGGEFGPDLEGVAQMHGLSIEEVVSIHSGAKYHVYCLGFVPGFGYLGGLPDEIATPRVDSPRKVVTPGSVGIGGNQSGVYPFPTPGGWRLIGRTPLTMFDESRTPMSLLSLGDEVRFRAITMDEFQA